MWWAGHESGIYNGRTARRATRAAARGHAASLLLIFLFYYVKIATPPDEELVVMTRFLTLDPNPTAGRTGSDATFQPAVKRVCRVVLAFQKFVHNAKKDQLHACMRIFSIGGCSEIDDRSSITRPGRVSTSHQPCSSPFVLCFAQELNLCTWDADESW